MKGNALQIARVPCGCAGGQRRTYEGFVFTLLQRAIAAHVLTAYYSCKLLCSSLQYSDPKSVYDDIRNSPLSTILPVLPLPLNAPPAPPSAPAPPLVVAHGMGDSCFNKGMKQITAEGGKRVNAYSVCIPTGNNDIEDTINGFLLNLDKSIDVFAAKVRNDTMLKDGFNAFSLSQGGR